MFVEFDAMALKEWDVLSKEQKKEVIMNQDVDLAVNVIIKTERHQKILEEHKYYQATKKMKLANDILISNINEEEVTFSINVNGNSELISIKLGDEKIIEVGNSPYSIILKIKVLNIQYGRIVEL